MMRLNVVILLTAGLLSPTVAKVLAQDWFQTGQAADIVLGPYPNSGGPSPLHHPSRVCASSGRLFVADTRNNRVLIWNTIPTTNYQPADVVVGQPDMYSNNSGGDSTGLNWPIGVYSDGVHLFVADANNHRVLIWDSLPTANGEPADIVLGQPDFNSYEEAGGATGDTTLSWPWDVFYDGQRLYVACAHDGGRVLIWNSLPTHNNQSADVVIGNPDFGPNSPTEPDAANLASPRGIASNGTVLAINDYQFHRVLIWDSIPTHNGDSADVVLGQPDFTTITEEFSTHGGISMHGDTLYVVANHNIWVWTNIYTLTNGQDPDYIIGRSDKQPGLSTEALSAPWGVSTDGTRLYVGDVNNSRVLVYNSIPAGPDVPADVVLGQEDFNKNVFLSRRGIRSVSGVASSGQDLLLATHMEGRIVLHNGLPEHDSASADYTLSSVDFDIPSPLFPRPENTYQCSQIWTDGSCIYTLELHRGILMWDSIPHTSLVPPDRWICRTEGCSDTSLNQAQGITSDGTRLYVSDGGNNRVLIWNTIPKKNGVKPDIVLGQADFNSSSPGLMNFPSRIATDGKRLAVADMEHHRILIWDSIPTYNNQPPDIKLFDFYPGRNLPWRFNGPQGVFIFDNHLFVADVGFNRVLIWNTFPTYDDQPADVILGQPDSMAGRPMKSRDGLYSPLNIWFDGEYLWVGEFKFADRVLGYRANITATAPAAPCSFTITEVSSHQINLNWVDNATNERGFKVERKTASEAYSEVAFLSANTTYYSSKALNANTQYFYRVKAYNHYDESGYSNEVDTTTLGTNSPPDTPYQPTPSDSIFGVPDSLWLLWEATDPDPGDQLVYTLCFDTYNPPVFILASNQSGKRFYPGKLSYNTWYYWRIIAIDLSGAETAGPVWKFQIGCDSPDTNRITISATSGGTTYPRPGSYIYKTGNFFSLTAIPDSSYLFSGWTGDITDTTNPISVTMNSNKSITANFISVGVDEFAVPVEYKLFQNNPNPFSTTTLIKYLLPAKSFVSIIIYDITGREVKTLLSGIKPAGYYEIVWDGKNNQGRQVSSGLYFYKLKTGKVNKTKRMLLIK